MPSSGSAPRKEATDGVITLPVDRDEAAMVRGLQTGEPWAVAALFDRHGPMVERVLRRVLGHERHTELADLLHEVFVQAMSSAHKLRDPGALRAWLQGIAVYTACRTIRYRKARRWLRFYGPEELPEQPSMDVPHEVREAFARTYAVLERMPAAERAVFSLRYVEGMQVDELARALDVSASTVKRRLGKAVQRFLRLARNDRVLAEWLGDKDVEQ